MHFVELRAGNIVAKSDDAAGTGPKLFDGVDRARVVCAVDSGLHYDDALGVQGAVK
jgi:hypothetical protein